VIIGTGSEIAGRLVVLLNPATIFSSAQLLAG
jgi:hypothetical protein